MQAGKKIVTGTTGQHMQLHSTMSVSWTEAMEG